MGRTAVIIIGLLVLAGVVVVYGVNNWRRYQPATASPPPASPASKPEIAVVAVPVEGMSCAACVASVRKAVNSVHGVTGVEVNLAQRETRVQYQSEKASPDQIVTAINKMGFKAGDPKPETR